nr:hypothetical protein KV8917_900034 [Klebsiella variicola]
MPTQVRKVELAGNYASDIEEAWVDSSGLMGYLGEKISLKYGLILKWDIK